MQKLCIYIVEDNDLMATTLEHMLTNIGHKICGVASNYAQAVDDLQKLNCDLVIIDIILEGYESGIDLAKFINKNLKIPFIIHSSVNNSKILRLAYETCPKAFLLKPLNQPALVKALSMLPSNAVSG